MITKHMGEDMTLIQIKDLEKGIYNWCIDYATQRGIIKNWDNGVFVQLYMDKFMSVMANLDKSSYVKNQDLLPRLMNNEFQPQHIAFMTREHVYPGVWRDIIDEKIKRDANIGENTVTAMTTQYKCGRCKKRECVYYELQTRSADEPTDLRITCLNCGNKWRIN